VSSSFLLLYSERAADEIGLTKFCGTGQKNCLSSSDGYDCYKILIIVTYFQRSKLFRVLRKEGKEERGRSPTPIAITITIANWVPDWQWQIWGFSAVVSLHSNNPHYYILVSIHTIGVQCRVMYLLLKMLFV